MNKSTIIAVLLCLAIVPAYAADSSWFWKKKKKSREEKTHVEEVVQPQQPKAEEAPKEFVLTNPEKELSGEWTITKVKNRKVNGDERAFLNFDIARHRLYGNNGGNLINGKFAIDGNKITFSGIVTTSSYVTSHSRDIVKALPDVHSLSIEMVNGVETLHLLSKNGHDLLTLTRANYSFACGAWTVTEIDGESTLSQEVRLVIDTDQLKVHGNTGCNIINGDIVLDYHRKNGIQFENIISNGNKGYNINRETKLLVALEETVSCTLNDNELALYDKRGNVVARLTPLTLQRTADNK